MMNTISVGPLQLLFTPNDVEMRSEYCAEVTKLTYAECYSLLEALYQRREELYRHTHDEGQQGEDTAPQFVAEQRLTYVVDGTSLAVASWDDDAVQ